jgi:xanthine dehydrogenase accessory factor
MVRCVLTPATELPADIWPRLIAREPLCLVSRVEGDVILDTLWFDRESIVQAGTAARDLFSRGAAAVELVDGTVITVLVPTPKLVVMGGGAIADALHGAARLLGWQVVVTTDPDMATGLAAGLSAMDQLVVMGHEVEPVGRVLAAALDSEVGYIGALGSRRMQEQRAEWLAYRGVVDLERIHGPAGLHIGARTPGEIAVSIVAEALAVRHATASAVP